MAANWFTRLFSSKSYTDGEEKRALTFQDVWGSGAEPTSAVISETRALCLTPVYASVRLLADGVASAPIKAYAGTSPTTRPEFVERPLGSVGSTYDWVHRAMTSLALRGNAYGLVMEVDNRGYPTVIEWLHPDDVQIKDDRAISDPRWYVMQREVEHFPHGPLVHIAGFVLPGRVTGMSPIQAFATTANAGLGAQDFGANWFINDATPSAVLESQAQITAEQAADIKTRFKAAAKARDIVAMGVGLTYKPISVPASEAQFLETIQASATQIAAVYGVPPERVGGEAGGSLTYSTLEQNDLSLNTYALAPYAIRLEQAFNRLLPEGRYVKFNLDARVRADITTRYQAHQIARQTGFMSVNEIRALEDLEPIEGGDDYTPLGGASPAAVPADDEGTPVDE